MTVCYIGFREAGFFSEEVDLDTLSNENGFDYDLPPLSTKRFPGTCREYFPWRDKPCKCKTGIYNIAKHDK